MRWPYVAMWSTWFWRKQTRSGHSAFPVCILPWAIRAISWRAFSTMYSNGSAAIRSSRAYITRVPFTVKCLECGYIYHVDVHDPDTLPCPKCGKKRYTLHSGMEFFINDIEVVMPSEPIKEQ